MNQSTRFNPLTSKSHFIFSVESPLYHPAVELPTHHQALEWLNGHGEHAVGAAGHYGMPERSIIVSNPKNIEGLKQLAQDIGQESVIVSKNGKHELHYLNGPKKGQVIHGEGTVVHSEPPLDNYTAVTDENGDQVYFTHNFDFPAEEPMHKSQDLEKGLRGDWKKEGYRFEYYSGQIGNIKKHSIIAYHPNGKPVGEYHFNEHSDHIQPSMVKTLRTHTRKGLATEAYRMAEEKSGKPVRPGWSVTNQAKALWNQPNRPFGKSESLQKSPIIYNDYNPDSYHPRGGMPDFMGNDNYRHIKSVKLPNGLEYRQFSMPKSPANSSKRIHAIYNPHDNYSPLSYVETEHAVDSAAPRGYHPHAVNWSEVDPDYRGLGLGRQAYLAALVHGNGRVTSGDRVSPEAHSMWTDFKHYPGLGGRVFGADDSLDQRHHVFVRDKNQLNHNLMFPPVDLHAGELDLHKAILEDALLEKAVRLSPTKEGQIDVSTGDVAKFHPNGQLMWHAGPEKAASHDAVLQNQDLINNYTNNFKHNAHKQAFNKIVQNVLKNPNRHFIPTLENVNGVDSHALRARHIKSLLLGDNNYTMDLSDPNKLSITALKRHGSNESPTTWTYSIARKGAGNDQLKRSEGSYEIGSAGDSEYVLRFERSSEHHRGDEPLAKNSRNAEYDYWRETSDRSGRIKLEQLEKALKPEDTKVLNDATHQPGKKAVDSAGHIKYFNKTHKNYAKILNDKKEYPSHYATHDNMDNYDGISAKVIHKVGKQTHNKPQEVYMAKPYHTAVEEWASPWMKHPIRGWASLTTKKLFDVAGLGNQAEDVAGHDDPKTPLVISKFHPTAQSLSSSAPSDLNSDLKIALIDFLTNNQDRHCGNIMNTNGKTFAIDHDRNFQYFKNKDDSDQVPNANPGKTLRDSYLPSKKRHPVHIVNEMPKILDWWAKSGDNIKKELHNNSRFIKDPDIRRHVEDNFNHRWEWLNDQMTHQPDSVFEVGHNDVDMLPYINRKKKVSHD